MTDFSKQIDKLQTELYLARNYAAQAERKLVDVNYDAKNIGGKQLAAKRAWELADERALLLATQLAHLQAEQQSAQRELDDA